VNSWNTLLISAFAQQKGGLQLQTALPHTLQPHMRVARHASESDVWMGEAAKNFWDTLLISAFAQ